MKTLRVPGMVTVEEPLALAEAIAANSKPHTLVVVDCLTLWMSNCLGSADIGALTVTLRQQCCPVVLVSNELGQGIVPDNALARRFRDDHGRMNQAVAALADQVWMAVSGMPLRLKPMAESPDDPI